MYIIRTASSLRSLFDRCSFFACSYVVVENLRYMLSSKDSQEPIYFGCRFKPFVKQGYMSGGAGYVLSKAALDSFAEKALNNPRLCRSDNDGSEDVEIGWYTSTA
jgi:glycoprotein-N-acetylgalactosamine 3-beta-galactosyltransferase